MTDFSHLNAIQSRLYRVEQRLAAAIQSGNKLEQAFRELQVSQAKKEEAAEYVFLGIEPAPVDEEMSIDDILAELVL